MVWERAISMVRLARPLVIVAGLLAFLTGACMAYWTLGELPWADTTAGLLIMVSAIIMGHYANEYADFDTDSFLGLSLLLTVLSFIIGLIGWAVVCLVFIGLPLGWFYSMPPFSLERTWLGELDNALLGTMMFMIGYVASVGEFDVEMLAFSIPIFFAVLINLLGVHFADRKADEMVGKRTMAVVLGQKSTRLFWILIVAMYISTVVLIPVLPLAVIAACFATLPIAAWAVRGFTRNGGPQYGTVLMGSFFTFAAIGFLLV
jgi:1,4-dihydroxy-2-naphthoate octaprenyltransferase